MTGLTKSWRPRESVLVRFADGPVPLHERILLCRQDRDAWMVATPDREIPKLDFNSSDLDEALEFTCVRWVPFSGAQRRRACLLTRGRQGWISHC